MRYKDGYRKPKHEYFVLINLGWYNDHAATAAETKNVRLVKLKVEIGQFTIYKVYGSKYTLPKYLRFCRQFRNKSDIIGELIKVTDDDTDSTIKWWN